MKSERKCNRCHRKAHHLHHKDGNHKNNTPSNFEHLCIFCHAKEHGIKPNLSRLKVLVTYYHKAQKLRIMLNKNIENLEILELKCPKQLKQASKMFKKMQNHYDWEIEKYWRNNPTSIYNWASQIKGAGDIMLAKILSEINFGKISSYTSLWAYAGLSPNQTKKKGIDCNWNHRLRAYCFQLAKCMIQKRTPKYREIYDREKEKQMNKGLSRNHSHNRAIRKMVKTFLRDLYKHRGERPLKESPKTKSHLVLVPTN